MRLTRSLPADRSDELALRGLLDEEIVRVAVPPALAGFERADHRVRCRPIVLRCVLIRRVVAASDVATLETEPKVDPAVAGGETFLATLRRIRAVVPRLTEVNAQRLRHLLSLRYVVGCWYRRTGESRR